MAAIPQDFPKCERIRKRTEYLSVQGRGRKLHSDSFLVFVQAAPRARFGITVSKKVGNAVERNHVKRLVREVVRRNKAWFPTSAELVFVAKRQAAGLDYAGVKREVERLCARHFAKS